MFYRLTFFKGEEVIYQQDADNTEYLEGYADGYLNFCSSEIDYVITRIEK